MDDEQQCKWEEEQRDSGGELFYSGHKKVGCEPVVLPGPPTSFLQKDDCLRAPAL